MKARVLILLVVSVSLTLAYFKEKPVLYADNQTYQLYEVTIDGFVGDRPFTRTGALFVTPVQGYDAGIASPNQVNFWLISGKPSGTAGKGAIWLATSNIFYSGKESEQFAVVSVLDNRLDAFFGPESGVINANAFSFSSDASENAVQLVGGELHLNMQLDGRVEGTLVIAGLDATAQTLTYSATITGSFIGERTW